MKIINLKIIANSTYRILILKKIVELKLILYINQIYFKKYNFLKLKEMKDKKQTV